MLSAGNDHGIAGLHLRPPVVADCAGVIALVDAVYREYGDKVCLDDADRDLTEIHQHYARLGGQCVVLTDGQHIFGLHAVVPLADRAGVCTFRRLYLDRSLRGAGWGEKLMRWALDTATTLGFQRVEFWSDTRFERAHRFFARLGFLRDGRERTMTDAWEPYREYFFYQDIGE